MSNLFDDETEAAFEMFLGLDDDTKAEIKAEKIATAALVDQLEAEFRDRGLKFTQPFAGAVPVQAYGHLDGMRFYFRFRGNHGSLQVGPVDEALDRQYALRMNEDEEDRRREYEQKIAAGGERDRFMESLHNRVHYPQLETDRQYYPHIFHKTARQQGPDPDDGWAGWLPNDQLGDLFRDLVNNLEDIPEDERYDEGLRIWMEQGRAAKKVHDEKRSAEFLAKWLAEQTPELRAKYEAELEEQRLAKEAKIAEMAEEAEKED